MIFSTDLDHTLIFTQGRLLGGQPVIPAEYRLGEPFTYMTPRAMSALRRIQQKAVCLVNTLRGREQAERVTFVGDGSCRYLALQNGLYLYRDGVLDEDWARLVAAHVRALPISLGEGVSAVLDGLPGIRCLSKQYEYLAVFFVEPEDFDGTACGQLAGQLAAQGWELFRERKKLYLSPLGIHKGSVVERVRLLEGGDQALGFGDSWFDLPMLAACGEAYSLAGSALAGMETGLPIRFSRQPAQGGAEEVLGWVEARLWGGPAA